MGCRRFSGGGHHPGGGPPQSGHPIHLLLGNLSTVYDEKVVTRALKLNVNTPGKKDSSEIHRNFS